MEYEEYNDYELINYISEDSEEANDIMFKKYEPLILNIAKKIYKYASKYGLEQNDLIQEGMLGLSDAIHTFKDNKEAIFYTYAKTCIEHKMISLVISSNRLKHRILNESISLEGTNRTGEATNIEYLFKDDRKNPENILLSEEYEKEIVQKAEKILTPLELQVFELKINGFDYKEIAEMIDKEPKSIDNALQRIKHKLEIIKREN